MLLKLYGVQAGFTGSHSACAQSILLPDGPGWGVCLVLCKARTSFRVPHAQHGSTCCFDCQHSMTFSELPLHGTGPASFGCCVGSGFFQLLVESDDCSRTCASAQFSPPEYACGMQSCRPQQPTGHGRCKCIASAMLA